MEKMEARYAPLLEYVQQQQAEQTKTRFYKTYESLTDPRFEGVINAYAQTLAQRQFKDEGDYFKALAEGAAAQIKGLLPDFDLGAKKQTKTAVTSPRLPRTSVGGTGGTGNGNTTTPKTTNGDQSSEIPW